MVDVNVAVAALRSDAKIWQNAAHQLDAPKQAIAGLNLAEPDVSMYGSDAGIDRTYAQAQQALQDMLTQGAENFNNLAQSLLHAADLYDTTETGNVHGLHHAGGH